MVPELEEGGGGGWMRTFMMVAHRPVPPESPPGHYGELSPEPVKWGPKPWKGLSL